MMRYYNPKVDPTVLRMGLGYEEAIHFTFQRIDHNGSGDISEAELLHFFTDLTPHVDSEEAFQHLVRSIFIRKR